MNKKSCWYCADFETTSYEQYKQEGRTRVYLWKMICGFDRKEYLGISIESFFEELNKITYVNPTIYFHNLNFDGEFILWYLLEHGYTSVENKTNIVLHKREFTSIIDDTGSIYRLKVHLDSNNDVEFACSYKLFPKSIKDIGKMVGLEKLDETHDYEEIKNYNSIDDVTEEEKMYINNDVQIMVRLIEYLRSVNVTGITMSASAYKNWRNDKGNYFLIKQELQRDENEEIEEIVRKSYRGGITMINPECVGEDIYDCMSFDVNSLYPSVMYNDSMPVGNGKIYKTIQETNKAGRYAYIVVCAVVHAEIKDDCIPFVGDQSGFSYSRKYSYSPTLENKVLYLWDKEFQLFSQCYKGKWEILKVVGWKTKKGIFKEYIDRWYDVKKNAINETERGLAKLMLNSLYGKFGMNDNRATKVPCGISQDGGILYDVIDVVSIYYAKKIASRITSRARCKLVTFLEMTGRDKFIYCDTDSIYMRGHEEPEYLKDFIHPTELGKFKNEGHYTHFRGWKAKCYMKQMDNGTIKHSIAGCPKETAKQFTWDNFKPNTILENGKRIKKKVTGGIIITTTNFEIHL